MTNLLKFEPEPFDNDFPFKAPALGPASVEAEFEEEVRRRGGGSTRSVASRMSATFNRQKTSWGSTARQTQRFGKSTAPSSALRRPYLSPQDGFSYRVRRRWVPGVADIDLDPTLVASDHVRWVQTCLNGFLGLSLPVDGVLSSSTRNALRTFQERRGLPINGRIGPETETALQDACRAAGAPAPQDDAAPADAPAQEIDARGAASSGDSPTTLPNNIVRVAKEELARWENGTVKETHPRNRTVLRDYWKTGTGQAYSAAQIASPAFQAAHPWSAAFISWVMRQAGAGDAFKYSASHSVYTAAAKHNRIANNANPFKAYRISEVVPQLGDLVCKSRAGSGATYDTIRAGMKTHCDIVTGIGPAGLEVIGGNVSNSVSKRRVQLNEAGHIKDPDYFAVIRSTASPAQAPSSPLAQPKLLKRESVPPGTTLYLAIDLNITDKFGITAPPMTGVFIPDGVVPTGAVDIVLYLHGHKGGAMRKLGVDQYWNAKKFPYGAFREEFTQSDRRAILVVPSLGSRSEAGRLNTPGGLDAFLGQVLAGIAAHGGGMQPNKEKLELGHLIFACHSGGGVPMRRVSGGSNASLAKLRECWGFDCTYNTGDDTFWAGWARRSASRKCYFYYISASQTAPLAERLRDKQIPNVIVAASAENRHNYVPLKYWAERLRGAAFLAARSGGSEANPPMSNGPTGEPNVKSLSRPEFIAFVGDHARTAMAATGVPASVTVAQAILETGWGKHSIDDAKNLFGIKGKGPAGSIRVPTKEFIDGKWTTVEANFAKYDSFAQSIMEHARFLVRNRRYAPAFQVKDDADAFARALHKAGYATAPNYAQQLIALMKRHDLYRFDRASGRPRNPAIERFAQIGA